MIFQIKRMSFRIASEKSFFLEVAKNALNSEDRGLKVRFSLAMGLKLKDFSKQICKRLLLFFLVSCCLAGVYCTPSAWTAFDRSACLQRFGPLRRGRSFAISFGGGEVGE